MQIQHLKKKYKKIFNVSNEDFFYECIFGYNQISELLMNGDFKNVLEIGSGSGLLINELSEAFTRIRFFGVEPFQSGYHKFEEFHKVINFDKVVIKNDAVEDLDFDQKFDLIFSINVMEHVKDWRKYIFNTQSLLNKDGINLILCPNYDFPYESHYGIPIIYNKSITKFIFSKKIIRDDKTNNQIGHWNGINFISKRKINQFLKENKIPHSFDSKIKDIMINRINYDQGLKSRQGFIGLLASFAQKLYVDKLIFDFLKIPFPYMKLIIKK